MRINIPVREYILNTGTRITIGTLFAADTINITANAQNTMYTTTLTMATDRYDIAAGCCGGAASGCCGGAALSETAKDLGVPKTVTVLDTPTTSVVTGGISGISPVTINADCCIGILLSTIRARLLAVPVLVLAMYNLPELCCRVHMCQRIRIICLLLHTITWSCDYILSLGRATV